MPDPNSSKVSAGMQFLVKLVQAAIFLAVIVWGLSDPTLPQNGVALGVVAIMVVAVVTVAPWLVFKMIEQAVSDLRRWLKPARVNAVVPELLDDALPRRRIAGQSLTRRSQ
jgi:hypothetical protein